MDNQQEWRKARPRPVSYGMKELRDALTQDALHHAYLIEKGEETISALLSFVEQELEMPVRGNPDMHVREHDRLGIDDARAIQSIEMQRAAQGDRKIFVISCNAMTREAQNALLKTFEEPTAGTHFFILMPSTEALLPTLLSRVQVIRTGERREEAPLAKQFLAASAPERIALVQDLIESKNKADALSFVNGLESALYRRVDFHNEEAVPAEAFETLQSVRSYLHDPSSSVKILLEHVATTLPRI